MNCPKCHQAIKNGECIKCGLCDIQPSKARPDLENKKTGNTYLERMMYYDPVKDGDEVPIKYDEVPVDANDIKLTNLGRLLIKRCTFEIGGVVIHEWNNK